MPYNCCKSSTTCRKLALSISISVTNIILERLYFSQISQAFFVPTSIPFLPDTTIIAASAALTASSTSPTKSKYPGVSKKLILVLSQITGTTEVWMENCLLISSLSKSLIVFPSEIFPIRVVMPDKYAIASTRLVFPAPPCPKSTTFLILSVVNTSIFHSSCTIDLCIYFTKSSYFLQLYYVLYTTFMNEL